MYILQPLGKINTHFVHPFGFIWAALSTHPMGSMLKKSYKKMENMWKKLHPLRTRESQADLGKYNDVSSKEKVVTPLKEGLHEAPRTLDGCNMAPAFQTHQELKKCFCIHS